MNNKKLVLLSVSISVLLLISTFAFVMPATGNYDGSYVIVVAPQEKTEWQPVINRLLVYHPSAIVLTLPEEIQTTVMEVERQFRFLLMDGSLKSYLIYAYYIWGYRSIPVPIGWIQSSFWLESQAIIYLDCHKAEIYRLFYNWFEKELGYQPHYIAMVGDIKTRRSDWVSALGMTIWWDGSLAYPADAWPSKITSAQVPVGYLPVVADECLAWYGYAVGRITGLRVADAVALVDSAGTYNDWAETNLDKASRFLASFTVGVNNYYSQLPGILTNAGFDMTGNWYAPESPYPTWANVTSVLNEGVGYWHLTCHGNFMTGMGGPGNGLITFPTDYSTGLYYNIPIGPGWSGIIWDLVNNDVLQSKTSMTIGDMPDFDHTIVRVSSCMTGSSEMPLQFVNKGAAAVIMGLPSQEVCECDGNVAYFYNALTHTNTVTEKQFTLGEAMAYANDNTHVLHYYYGPVAQGGMTIANSMYLIGDPALTPYVPDVGGSPEPLDPPGNNPGSMKSSVDLFIPMAIEGPSGVIILNICQSAERGSGAQRTR